jgi:cysteine-rich repeat protein
LDCLTCVPNYILRNSICQKLACSSTQYVQSTLGCVECVPTFPNSLKCLSTGPLTCRSGYILSNNSCQSCNQVTGYTYDSTTGKCKDFCGDGIIITDLCDDGNNFNGDGCSSVCTIESSWTCPNNLCALKGSPSLTLVSLTNNPTTHSLTLIIKLSIGLRLVQGNFILVFTNIGNFGFTLTTLDIYYTKYKLLITYYESPANNKLSLSVRSPIVTRMLTTSPLQLSINLNLSISVPIVTSPPAIYVSDA